MRYEKIIDVVVNTVGYTAGAIGFLLIFGIFVAAPIWTYHQEITDGLRALPGLILLDLSELKSFFSRPLSAMPTGTFIAILFIFLLLARSNGRR